MLFYKDVLRHYLITTAWFCQAFFLHRAQFSHWRELPAQTANKSGGEPVHAPGSSLAPGVAAALHRHSYGEPTTEETVPSLMRACNKEEMPKQWGRRQSKKPLCSWRQECRGFKKRERVRLGIGV